MLVYKIVLFEDGKLKNLFRGIEGTRELERGKWLKANKVMSVDGSGQEPYLTGIHCLPDLESAREYLKGFRKEKNRVIIECYADGLRKKPTNPNVLLADYLRIPDGNVVVS